MWNCGSARLAFVVLVGSGLCFSVAPETWLEISAVSAISLILLRTAGGPKRARLDEPVRDTLVTLFLLSAVGLSACLRIEGDAHHFQIVPERAGIVRGTVIGFPQPSDLGTDLILSSIGQDSLCAPYQKGARILAKIRGRNLRVSPGDTVTVAGLLRSPLAERNPGAFSEAAYLFVSHTNCVLTVPGFLKPAVRTADPPRGFVGSYMAPVHRWIRKGINRYVPGEERAFLLALVLGERESFQTR